MNLMQPIKLNSHTNNINIYKDIQTSSIWY